jgi:hypothetical protein
MPLLDASRLVSAQRNVAFRRHRLLWLVTTACVLASCVSDIADLHWPKTIAWLLWPAGLALVFLTLYLVHRDSRGPILAAACAWRASAPGYPDE